MIPEQYISLVSAAISFMGLLLVALQLRAGTQQRESESLVEILDINRQLISLGFSHPKLFAILHDAKNADPVWEQHYIQLWLNQFALIHAYQRNSVLRGELSENLRRDLIDFMAMENTQRIWHQRGKYYPASFQERVNEILKKVEPPVTAAQPTPK